MNDLLAEVLANNYQAVQALKSKERLVTMLSDGNLFVNIKDSAIVVSDISSLGLTAEDILNRLNLFISHNVCLFICKYSASYEYGMSQPLNKAVLTTLLQTFLNTNKDIVEIPRTKRTNSGRNKIAFPDGWDEMYKKWEIIKFHQKILLK